jgi:hypothetical protein
MLSYQQYHTVIHLIISCNNDDVEEKETVLYISIPLNLTCMYKVLYHLSGVICSFSAYTVLTLQTKIGKFIW